MNAEFESMTLPELVDRLEDLDGRRTPVGWTPDDAVERASIERVILAMISDDRAEQRSSVPCAMDVKVRSADRSVPGLVQRIGSGGIMVATEASDWVPGTHVELQIRPSDSEEHGLKVRGIIRGIDGRNVRVSVSEQPSEAHERRLRRFVLELIRHRVHN
jgi:hypothetical protein